MNKLFYNLGNLLVVLSLAGFIFLFYPFISIYLFPPSLNNQVSAVGTFITIPKIHAQAPVVVNVDPWKETEYKEALKKGIAQAKDTNFFFAHSSGMPWELAKYNTIFLRLGELQNGDTIIVEKDGKKQTYVVKDKKEVWPTDVSYLKNPPKGQIILQTCTPIGTSLKRLLVFAAPAN
jgi:LPXTG-site transpeptidase (sortase) family protein